MSGTDLRGRRVLLTGASSGIGAVTCRALVAAGASVAMVARRKERLEALEVDLGERAIAVAADVTDSVALAAAVHRAAERLGGLDTVVTVAGRAMAGGMVTGDPQTWRALFELNLLAPLATVRYAYPYFSSEGRRDIVVVASAAALTPLPTAGVYGASKRGLLAACETLRLEVAADGVSVGVVIPGMFETEGLTLEGIVIDGDVPVNDFPLFAPDTLPGPPEVVADTIVFMLGLPQGTAINQVVIRPTGEFTP
ncbi:MAG TPA: SDR family NAD(P)-dependent oxidoreductase [Mycobacteriales bacterium]|nr:SDR family NAD(P)-dependent oxidoreductase [Mycobacteriales bacterium]